MCATWLAALEVTLGVRLKPVGGEGVGERAEGLSEGGRGYWKEARTERPLRG